MRTKKNLTYIISNISKVIAFEWISKTYDSSLFNVTFIFLNDGAAETRQFLTAHNFTCYHINYTSKKDIPSAVYQTIKILRKEKTDIVHAHLLDASLVGLIAAKFTGIKKRVHTRHHSLQHHEKFKKGVMMDNFNNWLSTDIIVISKNVQNIVQEKEHFYKDKIHLVYHGFDLEEFAVVSPERIEHIKQKYAISQYPIIGVISRYIKLKGIQYIAEAFVKLLEDYPKAVLLIANAKGPDLEFVKTYLNKIPQENLIEVIYEKDMPAFYKTMNVFVHTPIDEKSEAFGQTYIEAMASSVPGVYTLSGIATEYILNNKNALVVDYKNADEIHMAIKRYLQDESLRNAISIQAKFDVNRLFSLQKMNEELKKIYLT